MEYSNSSSDFDGRGADGTGAKYHAEYEPKSSYATTQELEARERAKLQESTTLAEGGDDPRYIEPTDGYEGKHRWDPEFEWKPEEERRIVRKIDLRICLFCCITFFALQLDRGNLVQAVSDNMLSDINLSTNDYNTGQTVFYVCFLIAELPSQLVSKKLGAERWIPIQMVCWSLVASCQAFLSGKGSYFATRALMGVFEGGFIPDTVLFLSYWYTSKELPPRLSLYWVAYQSTSIVGAFLAFGFLHLNGLNGLAGWRYLFAFEGLITGVVGIFAAFYMPPSPTQTAGWTRGKRGWFNEREEKIMVNRVLRDDPSKGDMHNRQAVTPKLLWRSLCDVDLWPLYLIGISWDIPPTPATSYLTLELRGLNFSTFETNLLTIPAYVLFIIQLLAVTWLSQRVNERLFICAGSQVYNLVVLIALRTIPDSTGAWPRWVLLTLLVGSPYIHAILVAMTSRNAGSVRTRAVASALYNMSVQVSSIIGNNIYRNNDKPYYHVGNTVLLGITAYNIVLFIASKFYYIWRNRTRDVFWNSMTDEQRAAYLADPQNRLLGSKRLDFRFAH